MSRFRAMFVTTGLFILAAAVAINGWAQGPGGGGGRGGRGGGPGGGFGGPGGFGGRGMGGPGGDSLLSLALRPTVQEELKLTDKQKTQLNELNEDFNQRRQKLMETMRPNGGNGGSNGGGNGGNGRGGRNRNNNNGGNGNNPTNGTTSNSGGINPYTTAYNVNPYALNVSSQQPVQQAQEPQQDDRQARFQAMREAMNELDQNSNDTLARILSPKQFQRLNQIQIQLQGINALVRPEVAEKIRLDETQVEAIQAVINDRRTAQREVFSKQGNLFRSFRNQNGGGPNAKNQNQAGAVAKGDAAPPADGAQVNTKGAGANGPGNGRRGGPGGFDREAMKKFMEQPEVKAQIDQTQLETAKLDAQATQAAYQIMTKYQVAAFKKLQGPPFDIAQLRPNFGGPGGNRNGGAAPATKSAAGSTTEKAEATKDTASTTSDTKKATTSKTKAKSSTKKRTNRQSRQSDVDPGLMDIPTDFDQN